MPATASDRPWLGQYPTGVPAQVDATAYPSLVALLEEAWQRHPDRDATLCMGSRLRYRDIDALSLTLAAWLQQQGLARGDRVAVMMPNLPPYLPLLGAILRAGCVVVNVNPLYTPRELSHQLRDSGAKVLFVLENFAGTLEAITEPLPLRHIVLCAMGDLMGPWRGTLVNFVVRHVRKLVPPHTLASDARRQVTRLGAVLRAGRRHAFQPVPLGPNDVAFLQYTGGTTGVAKGATLLHRNLVANVLQIDAWFSPVLQRLGEQPLTMVAALPLYHIFALTLCGLFSSRRGMLNLLIPNPRDLDGLVKTLGQHRVHLFPAVNTLFNALTEHPGFAGLDFSELVVSVGGGMAVQQATAERWLRLTGCPIVEGYGLSETSPVATCNRLDLRAFSGTIGLPLPSTDIAIRDDAGQDVAPGQAGEICIRGPQVMAGYWNRPDETAKVMTADGFLRSGDIGIMDERGYVRIVDRKKDMILVSGFNVYPNEIEQVVSLHPGVSECAAVGIPDPHSGEAVKLFVVRRDPALSEADIRHYCHDNFTAYKRPKVIEFCEDLPKTSVGKVLRRALREQGAAAPLA
ncbi:long-chain-fatty-acid--CoA ligase [Ideonella sp. B7]|nr:long-chain-fatty-acid--CoA ligase [Ideonella benzenivorans]